MSYYTFKVFSTKEDILTKQFSAQDCIDLNFLLNNKDNLGVDKFCEEKFKNYTGKDTKLTNFDKFLYLFSQKIMSHSYEVTVLHKRGEEKINYVVNLVQLYNLIDSASFVTNQVYNDGCLVIEYGIPNDLSCVSNFLIKSIKTPDKTFYNVTDPDVLAFLPVELYKEITKMQAKNNEIIKSSLYEDAFLRELTFTNDEFLYFLTFIYSENIENFYFLTYTLQKDYNISMSFCRSITLRDLYLIVDTINRDNNDKKNKQGRYEQ